MRKATTIERNQRLKWALESEVVAAPATTASATKSPASVISEAEREAWYRAQAGYDVTPANCTQPTAVTLRSARCYNVPAGTYLIMADTTVYNNNALAELRAAIFVNISVISSSIRTMQSAANQERSINMVDIETLTPTSTIELRYYINSASYRVYMLARTLYIIRIACFFLKVPLSKRSKLPRLHVWFYLALHAHVGHGRRRLCQQMPRHGLGPLLGCSYGEGDWITKCKVPGSRKLSGHARKRCAKLNGSSRL